MPRFDKQTGKLIDADAPITTPTIADSLPKESVTASDEGIQINATVAKQDMFTPQDVLAILQTMNQQNRDANMEMIRELKKPTEAEAKKLEDEHKRQVAMAKNSAEQAKLDEVFRTQGQATCSHSRKDGSTAIVGQVNSDGYVRPFCSYCRKTFPRIKAHQEWITSGFQTQAAEDVSGALRYIKAEHLLAWHKSTVPECTDSCCKSVAVA